MFDETEANVTGIAPDNMYRMSRFFAEHMSFCPTKLNGHRLLHALLHRTCRSLPEWTPDACQPAEGYRRRSIELRRTLGLEARNDNSELREGIDELSKTGWFQTIHFVHGNEFIAWRFDDETLSDILDHRAYGLLDASALHRLKKVVDFQVFSQVSVVRRMRKPELNFILPQVEPWFDKVEMRWADAGEGIIEAIQRSCAHYGITACVLLRRSGILRGIDSIEIRLCRPGNAWPMKDLVKFKTEPAKSLFVDSGNIIKVPTKELPEFCMRLRDARWRLGSVRQPTQRNSHRNG